LENIARLKDISTPKQKGNLSDWLEMGPENKNLPNTDLRLLVLLAGKEEFNEKNNPLKYKGLDLFKKYFKKRVVGKEIWKDPDKATDFLNHPKYIDAYQKLHFRYIKDTIDKAQSPHKTFKNKGGDCEDYGIFTSFCLQKAGYETSALLVVWKEGSGHMVATYKKDGELYVLDNGTPIYITGIRQFNSLIEIGKTLAEERGVNVKYIWAYDWKTTLRKFNKINGNKFYFRDSLVQPKK